MKRAASLTLRLLRDQTGVAYIEFAFVAPVLLLLILGGLELANYAAAHLRVNQIAMTVADNAGRVPTGIDEANVQEVFAGASMIGRPIAFEDNGRVILSSLQPNRQSGSRAGQTIKWQRCWGELDRDPAYGEEGDGANDASLAAGIGPSRNPILSSDGTAVMVVEVYYIYQPLIDTSYFVAPNAISEVSAFNVRGRQNNNLTNSQNLTQTTCD